VGSPGVEAWPLAWAASGIKGSHDISLWARASTPYIWGMTMPLYEKCGRRNLVTYHVEPKESWRVAVNDRWKSICPSRIVHGGRAHACALSVYWCARGIAERFSRTPKQPGRSDASQQPCGA
jgi:hypothetical protein